MRAPVILFVYCRLEHTKKTLEALEKNELVEETDLFIYSDNAKNEDIQERVDAVRNYIDEYEKRSSFKNVIIIKADKNKGLANSIIDGVNDIINKYEKAIIVEDDLITSTDFLKYMNGALDFYENNLQIGSISAYTYKVESLKGYSKDVYITNKGDCWGWGTWKDRWNNVDWDVSDYSVFLKDRNKRKQFDELERGLTHMLDMQMAGKLDSWAIRWVYSLFTRGLRTVYPTCSKAANIGVDGSGTHCKVSRKMDIDLDSKQGEYIFENLEVDDEIAKEVACYNTRTILSKILWIMAKILFRLGIKI